MVLNSRAIWSFLSNTKPWFDYFVFMLLLLSGFGLICIGKKIKITSTILVGAFTLYCLIFNVVRPYKESIFWMTAIAEMVIMLCVVNKNNNINPQKILIAFSNIVAMISIISLFFWFFGSVLKIISPSGTVYTTWTNSGEPKAIPSYYGLYFETQFLEMPFWGKVVRNSAVFTEGPMATFNFSLAFLIDLFVAQKQNKCKIFILAITIFSTFTTSGWLILVIGLFLYYLIKIPRNKVLRAIKILIVPAIISVSVIVALSMIGSKFGTSSGLIRMDDYVAGYLAWKEHKLFGAGYENYEFIEQFMQSWRNYNTGFSNSPMRILACCGIYIGILYIYAFAKGIIFSVKEKNMRLLIYVIATLLLFLTMMVPYQYIILINITWFGSLPLNKTRSIVNNGSKKNVRLFNCRIRLVRINICQRGN